MHALWHFPLLLLTPIYPIVGSWLIVGPIFLVTLTTAGVFYGYLQLRSKSVWPATLAHGVINTSFEWFAMFTITTSPLALEYLAGSGHHTRASTSMKEAVEASLNCDCPSDLGDESRVLLRDFAPYAWPTA